MRRRLTDRLAKARTAAAAQGGFTIVELMVALVILVTGILGLVAGFDSARRLSLVSERHATMAHIGEREIERVEGIQYGKIGLSTNPASPDFTPAHSSDTGNPDYYVSGGNLKVDRTGTATETLDFDASGQVPHFQTESDGNTTYNVYDYVTWTQDTQCAPACSGTQNYKRLTVAVSVNSNLQPTPVWSQSVIADPAATPPSACANAVCTNPISSPTTTCLDGSGNTIQCNNGISAGNTNNFYLHSDPIPPSGSLPTPAPVPGGSTNVVCTVSACDPASCPLSLSLIGGLLGNTSGCPTPDGMDPNPPTSTCSSNCSIGDPTPCYQYSKDVASTGYTCGIALPPSPPPGQGGCTSSCPGTGWSNCTTSCGGTGSASDCTGGQWANTLLSSQNHMWVGPVQPVNLTLTGDAALTTFSQILNNSAYTNALVSLCVELYDIPPSNGVANSLADILLTGSQPTAIGGAAYVPPTDPNTNSNWPAAMTQTSFTFRYLAGASATYTLPAGHRLGLRVWMKANVNDGINLAFDNPNYPSSLEVNSV